MSLSNSERDLLAREFEENLAQSGLTFEEFRQETGFPEARFLDAFMVFEGCDPADVEFIRGLLEEAVQRARQK